MNKAEHRCAELAKIGKKMERVRESNYKQFIKCQEELIFNLTTNNNKICYFKFEEKGLYCYFYSPSDYSSCSPQQQKCKINVECLLDWLQDNLTSVGD